MNMNMSTTPLRWQFWIDRGSRNSEQQQTLRYGGEVSQRVIKLPLELRCRASLRNARPPVGRRELAVVYAATST